MARAGVLALQGSSEPHLEKLTALAAAPVAVRQRRHLDQVDHLILPGGESTTIHHLLELFDLWQPLRERARAGQLALFGTCAGAILMGREAALRPPRLDLLDATVERNAYGRQRESFTRPVTLTGLGQPEITAVFIRAPRITDVGPRASVLARLDGDPILVQQPGLLAATFHPELTDSETVHEAFLEMPLPAATAAREVG